MMRNWIIQLTRNCLMNDGCNSNTIQIRQMSRVKKRFTMEPFWQAKKTRVLYPENLTSKNIDFIQEKISDQYASPLNLEQFVPEPYKHGSYRCGLIGKKIGYYPLWSTGGKRIEATLIQIPDNHVIKYIKPEDLVAQHIGYNRRVKNKSKVLGALVVGAESDDPSKFTKEYYNMFYEAGVMPKRRLTKFFITPNAMLPPGTPLLASHFKPGDMVDCQGITTDRGFQGVMKRWGFHGGNATHGNTKSHRRPGNIAATGSAARVMPGTKMPGHMGRHRRTHRGCKILRVNTKHNIIWVEGAAIPGEIGNYVIVFDSILYSNRLKSEDFKDYFPTFNLEGKKLEENLFHDSIHNFSRPSIIFEQDVKKKKR